MKKKFTVLLLAILILELLTSCGNNGNTDIPQTTPGISQSDYDALKSQNERLQTENDKLKSELETANAKIEELQNANPTAPIVPTDVEILIYDDDYVTISFIGCEMHRDNENVVFMVLNKTDSELTFQSGTMAIDGISLGHVSGSDSVAAQSKGKVRFRTEEEFPTMAPSTISGTISVIDFGKTLWGSQSYEVPFSNFDVTG
ncbi:MAG: hypothetical protein HDT35_08355 [Clostridiales bacterium]|nr:hypothetical protein [Clostridiales bacterium]